MEKLDLKKALKPFYSAKPAPAFVDVPAMKFLMIDGQGNPNTSADYAEVLQCLYSVAYTLKFTIKKERQIDYPVTALEGLWWAADMGAFIAGKKDDWFWTMMISVPDFISPEMVAQAGASAARKKTLPALPRLRLETFHEGLAAQLLHIGSYSDEAENIQRLHAFIHASGRSFDGPANKHHEIYLSDPRRVPVDKLKTIIRQPVNR